jgi:hypothetical protein
VVAATPSYSAPVLSWVLRCGLLPRMQVKVEETLFEGAVRVFFSISLRYLRI